MRLAAFIAGLFISTGAFSAGTSPRAVVETFLKDQVLVTKGLIDKNALWDSIDDSSLGQTYGNRWAEIKPQIKFNGWNHTSYSILRADGKFVIAGVSKPDWYGSTQYSLYQTRRTILGQYLIEPGRFQEGSRYLDSFSVDLKGLISTDSPTSKPRNNLPDLCAALQLPNPTKTERSDAVAAYVRLQLVERNNRKLWSHFDTSALEESVGAKNLQNIKTTVRVNSYSYASFKIEREFGDFVIVSVPKTLAEDSHVVFRVRKLQNGSFKFIPGTMLNGWIEPWVMSFSYFNDEQQEDALTRIGRYCSEITR